MRFRTPTSGGRKPPVRITCQAPSRPLNSANQIAVWQQDRWSNGGAHALMAAASFDGGHTWGAQTALPFNMCAPGGLAYERASDPWVSIGLDGHGGSVAYSISISFNR